jgi:hypothetical protein
VGKLVRSLFLLLAVATAYAQQCGPIEVRVSVKDSQESPIFDAQVTILGANKLPAPAIESTRSEGFAIFKSVPCGEWTVTVSKEGFEDRSALVTLGAQPVLKVVIALNPQINRTRVEVTDSAPPVEQSSSQNYELRPTEVKNLPSNPPTVADALPLVPGVVRAQNGELKIDGAGEERSSLVVNQTDVTDPATGKFAQTVPVDSIETVNVLNTPFLAQYGRFTQSVVAVETRRGGDKWHGDLNDPFPDFRVRSYHLVGIRNETPRGVIGGPIIANRLYLNTALQYLLDKRSNRTLPFPNNESKQERVNSFTQLDYIASQRQIINFTYHFSPEHINFVNPDFFTPQPVAPSYAQRAYVATLAHHLGLFGGTFDSSLSMQRFHTFIGAQGQEEMQIRPQGNTGNYFGRQSRDAWRREWLEGWSPAPMQFVGSHQFKVGTSVTVVNNRGYFDFRPVDILNAQGQRLQRIDFRSQGNYKRTDLEVTTYVQDHWSLRPNFAFDYGLRVEHQRLASSLRVAPRAGLAWTPFSNGRTVLRLGYGQFYDHIPTDVYAFSRYPERIITSYSPNGDIVGQPITLDNVIGDATGPRTFLIRGQRVAGDFSPRGKTWNAQVEHSFSRLLRFRTVYTDNRSVGLIILHPTVDGTNKVILNGDGASRYRQLEVTAKAGWESGQQLVFSYTHGRAEGSQNTFDSFLGNYANPILRPDTYSNLSGDIPNRFLVWGSLQAPFWQLKVLPTVEYRNGFAYASYDAQQNYSGAPYGDNTRLRNFFSADARVMRDFKVSPKYAVRLSLTGFNLTNHFNPLAIHSNMADPNYGVAFGNYHRRYRFDFEVIL